MIEQIKSQGFLPGNKKGDQYWVGMDNLDTYRKNCATQPHDWHYHDATVNYSFNSNRYRCAEFDQIDWKNSVVIFGCSHVFGIGLDDTDTISSNLSNIMNVPVVNMGIGGTSIAFSFYNNLILFDTLPTPIAIVHLWSTINRFVYFRNDGIENLNHGWDPNDFLINWSKTDANPLATSLIYQRITQQLCSTRCPLYEASFFKDTADLLECDQLFYHDLARDLTHPGRISAKIAAETIYNNIKIKV